MSEITFSIVYCYHFIMQQNFSEADDHYDIKNTSFLVAHFLLHSYFNEYNNLNDKNYETTGENDNFVKFFYKLLRILLIMNLLLY